VNSRYVVGLVFGFEHLLLLAAVLLQWSIHPVPKWVRVAVERRNYLALKKATDKGTRKDHHHHHH
jgi:hypothetical protein